MTFTFGTICAIGAYAFPTVLATVNIVHTVIMERVA